MIRPLAPRSLATLLCLLLGTAAPRAEEAVLLASTAPGYAPGMVVSENERILVPDGASATLLFRTGEMMRLRGPFEGPLGPAEGRAGGAASIITLAETLRLHGVDAAVVGGTRGLSVPPRRRGPDPELLVDPQRSATYCVGPGVEVWIARPDDELSDQILVRRHGVVREITWPATAVRTEWPADLPIADGVHYEIVDASGAARATLTFRVIDWRAPMDPARIAKTALAGCQEQVSTTLRELARTVAPRELWLASDRGRTPRYSAGDSMRLVVQANADGWLYCVHRSADGAVVPIFPSGALDGARVRGHEPLTIPGQRRTADLSAGPPGEGRVSCWFADRDMGPELPHALVVDAPRRLPDALAARLDAVFNEIGGTRLVKATLPVRVEQGDVFR